MFLLADFAGSLRRLLGKALHLGSDHREAAPGFTGASRFDGRVERQQIGLAGNRIDQLHSREATAIAMILRKPQVEPEAHDRTSLLQRLRASRSL